MNEKDDKLNKGSFLYIGDKDKAEWGYPEGYPYKEQKLVTEFLPEIELDFYEIEGYFPSDPDLDVQVPDFGIEKNKLYRLRIMWDGVPYERTVSVIKDYAYVVGNLALTGEGDDTGEPFSILIGRVTGGDYTYEVDFSFMGASAGKHTVSIAEISETIYPMASDFLPQANQTTYGAIKKAAHVPHVTEAPTSNDFNKLLSALREAGIMSQSE